MAHRLSSISGKIEMAYVGATPWHSLGESVSNLQTGAEMLIKAHMDWLVETTPVYQYINGVSSLVEGKAAIRRADDPRVVFDIASDHYRPIQNAESAEILDAITENGACVETMGAIDDGKTCWALARIPETYEVVKGDAIGNYILLTWSHDGKHGVRGKLTGIRVVCANTLGSAESGGFDFSIRHSKNAKVRLDEAREALGLVRKQVESTAELFQRLAARPLTSTESTAYVSTVFPYPASVPRESDSELIARLMGNPVSDLEKAAKQAMERVNEVRDTVTRLMGMGKGSEFASGTAWNAYNAVTEYTDHVYPVLQNGQVSAVKQQAVLFGATAKVKDRALSAAVDLLNV